MPVEPSFISTTLVAASLVLAGCGSPTTDEPAAETPASTTSESPTDPAAASGSEEAEEETPTVPLADGMTLKVKGMTAKVPKGWIRGPDFVMQDSAFPPRVYGTNVELFQFPASGLTTDEVAAGAGDRATWKFEPKRVEDVVIDGESNYHLSGKMNPGQYVDVYGAIVGENDLSITFFFINNEPRAYREDLIASVLPTVDYKN